MSGAYSRRDKAYYIGANETLPSGDRLVYGQQGEVVGPATSQEVKGKGVSVQFPGNKGRVQCYFTTVRLRLAPPLLGAPSLPPRLSRRRATPTPLAVTEAAHPRRSLACAQLSKEPP